MCLRKNRKRRYKDSRRLPTDQDSKLQPPSDNRLHTDLDPDNLVQVDEEKFPKEEKREISCQYCSIVSYELGRKYLIKDILWNIFRILDTEKNNYLLSEQVEEYFKNAYSLSFNCSKHKNLNIDEEKKIIIEEKIKRSEKAWNEKKIIGIYEFLNLFYYQELQINNIQEANENQKLQCIFERDFIVALHFLAWRKYHKKAANKYIAKIQNWTEKKWTYNQLDLCKKEQNADIKVLGIIGIVLEINKLRSVILGYLELFVSLLLFQKLYNAYLSSNKNNNYAFPLVVKVVAFIGPFLIAYSAQIQHFIISRSILRLNRKNAGFLKKLGASIFFSPLGIFYFFILYNLQIFLEIMTLGSSILGSLFSHVNSKLAERIFEISAKLKETFYNHFYSEQDFDGLLEQLNMTRVTFDNIPNLIIGICILQDAIHAPEFKEEESTLILSIALTLSNIVFMILTQIELSKFFKTDFLNYCLVCMKARFGWQPYLEALEKGEMKNLLDYSCVRAPALPFVADRLLLYNYKRWDFDSSSIKNLIKLIIEFKEEFKGEKFKSQALDLSRCIKKINVPDLLNLINLNDQNFRIFIYDKEQAISDCVKESNLEDKWNFYSLKGNSYQYESIFNENNNEYFNENLLKIMLKYGADPNPLEKNGKYLLTNVIQNKNLNHILVILIEQKSKINVKALDPIERESFFEIAYNHSNYEALEFLIKAFPEDFHYSVDGQATPFSKIIKNLRLDKLDEISKALKETNTFTFHEETETMILLLKNFCIDMENHDRSKILDSVKKFILIVKNNIEITYDFIIQWKDYTYWLVYYFRRNHSEITNIINKDKQKFFESHPIKLAISLKNHDAIIDLSTKFSGDINPEDKWLETDLINLLYSLYIQVGKFKLIDDITSALKLSDEMKRSLREKVSKLAKENKNDIVIKAIMEHEGKSKDIIPNNVSLANKQKIPQEIIVDDKFKVPYKSYLVPNLIQDESLEEFLKEHMKIVNISDGIKSKKTNSKNFFLTELMELAIEALSLFDFITDIIVLKSFFSTGDIIWGTLTIISIIIPYYISYAPLVTFLILRKNFVPSEKYRRIFGYFLLTAISLVFCILLDTVFTILGIISAIPFLGSKFLKSSDDLMDGLLKKLFKMQRIDIEGIRRLRIGAQFVFESIPQLILQFYILFRLNLGMNDSLIMSISCAILHTVFEFFLIVSEAKATKTNFFTCMAWLLNGRIGWVPFLEILSKRENLEGVALDFSKLQYTILGMTHNIEYCFSETTMRILNQTLLMMPEYEISKRPKQRLKIELGDTCKNVRLNDVLNLLRISENRLNLNTEHVDWKNLFEKEKQSQSGRDERLNINYESLINEFCKVGCLPAVKFLVNNKKFDLNFIKKSTSKENNPLYSAMQHQHSDVIQYLLEEGIEEFIYDGFDPFYQNSVYIENDDILDALIKSGMHLSFEKKKIILEKIKVLLDSDKKSEVDRGLLLTVYLGGPNSTIEQSNLKYHLQFCNKYKCLKNLEDYFPKEIIFQVKDNQSKIQNYYIDSEFALSLNSIRLNSSIEKQIVDRKKEVIYQLSADLFETMMNFFYILIKKGLPSKITLGDIKKIDAMLNIHKPVNIAYQYYALTSKFRLVESNVYKFSEQIDYSREERYKYEDYIKENPEFLCFYSPRKDNSVEWGWWKPYKIKTSDSTKSEYVLPEGLFLISRIYLKILFYDQGWGNESATKATLYFQGKKHAVVNDLGYYNRVVGKKETIFDYNCLDNFKQLNIFPCAIGGDKLALFVSGRCGGGHSLHFKYGNLFFEYININKYLEE